MKLWRALLNQSAHEAAAALESFAPCCERLLTVAAKASASELRGRPISQVQANTLSRLNARGVLIAVVAGELTGRELESAAAGVGVRSVNKVLPDGR